MIDNDQRADTEQSTFVGRGPELNALQSALDRALAGSGRLVLLTGPAGIGKTRVLREFAARAEAQGLRVLRGRCYEQPGAPAYWPWVQLLERYLDACSDQALQALLTPATEVVLTLVPALAARLPGKSQTAAPADPEQARFTLFDAVNRFWLSAARRQPLLLSIDDLHWADVPSLKLLEFCVADLAGERLLLLATLREDEIHRRHPLSDTLGQLVRLSEPLRLSLSGLSESESAALIATLSGATPAPGRVAAIHRRSEGNPLLLLELSRFLLQQDSLAYSTGAEPGEEPGPLPAGVRHIIGQRLNRLSVSCNRLLSIAAVMGRVFQLSVVTRLLDEMTEEGIWAALDEARAAHVLETLPEPDHYQFSHALIRETLYEEMLAARRLQLHRRIGETLEALSGEQPPLAQLAYHFYQSAPLGDSARAIAYGLRAAARAGALLAYEEAARFYRLALELLARYQPGAETRRCELLLELGEFQAKAGEALAALESFRQAAAVAQHAGLSALLARAALGFEEASWRPGLPGGPAVRLLREALALADSDDRRGRAQLLSALTRALGLSGDWQQADRTGRQALALARRCADPQTLIDTLRLSLASRWRPDRLHQRLAAAAEALALAEQTNDQQQILDLLGWRLFDLLELGDLAAVEAGLASHGRLAEQLHQPFYQYVNLTFRANLALFQGRFRDSERLAGEALALGQRMPGHDSDGVYGLQLFSLRREQGRLGELAPLVRHFVRTTPAAATWRPGLALIYSELGLLAEARAEFDRLAADDFAALADDGLRALCLAYLAEVCVTLNDTGRAALLYRLLLPYAGHHIVAGAAIVCTGAAARYLGCLALSLKRWQDAERHFESALALEAAGGARPWLAHSQVHTAELLLARPQNHRGGERERARELLTQARATAEALAMPVLAARAAALGTRLDAQADTRPTSARYPDGLSRREVEVLRQLAGGRNNRQIAATLFISPNTVANHIRNILTKTDTVNRTEAAAYAVRQRLLDD